MSFSEAEIKQWVLAEQAGNPKWWKLKPTSKAIMLRDLQHLARIAAVMLNSRDPKVILQYPLIQSSLQMIEHHPNYSVFLPRDEIDAAMHQAIHALNLVRDGQPSSYVIVEDQNGKRGSDQSTFIELDGLGEGSGRSDRPSDEDVRAPIVGHLPFEPDASPVQSREPEPPDAALVDATPTRPPASRHHWPSAPRLLRPGQKHLDEHRRVRDPDEDSDDDER